jgi:hypothetical protein
MPAYRPAVGFRFEKTMPEITATDSNSSIGPPDMTTPGFLLGPLLSNSSDVLRNLTTFGSSPLNRIQLILGSAEVPPTIAKRFVYYSAESILVSDVPAVYDYLIGIRQVLPIVGGERQIDSPIQALISTKLAGGHVYAPQVAKFLESYRIGEKSIHMGFEIPRLGFSDITYANVPDVIQSRHSVSLQSANSFFLVFGPSSLQLEGVLLRIRRLFRSNSRVSGGIGGLLVGAVHLDRIPRVHSQQRDTHNLHERFPFIPPVLLQLASNLIMNFSWWSLLATVWGWIAFWDRIF